MSRGLFLRSAAAAAATAEEEVMGEGLSSELARGRRGREEGRWRGERLRSPLRLLPPENDRDLERRVGEVCMGEAELCG